MDTRLAIDGTPGRDQHPSRPHRQDRSRPVNSTTPMPPVLPLATPLLWLVRVLALVSSLTAGWLTILKWLSPRVSIAGCGGSEGCATLLDSRWSNWFSVPVTLLAATLWTAVFFLTLPAANRWLGRTTDQLLATCAIFLIAGAVWFGTLMLAVVKVWCPWCAGLHLAALFVGGILLFATWKSTREGAVGIFCAAGQAGLAGGALLVLGQLFGKPPDTHLITVNPPPAASSAPASDNPETTWTFLRGTLQIPREEAPLLGSPDAPHLLAAFSDYTCTACRAQHTDLKELLAAQPGTYAILILPTPLDASCNPHVLASSTGKSGNSCALASLALSVWHHAPEQFPGFHEFLMTSTLPVTPEAARKEIARIAPQVTLNLQADWISPRIQANIAAWQGLSTETTKLPKLILTDDHILHGSTSSREKFLELIQQAFPPTDGIPVSTRTP